MNSLLSPAGVGVLVGALALTSGACQSSGAASPGAGRVTPVYDKQTGRLEQLVTDRQGDGKIDVRAHMEGTRVTSVEIDRNRDGHPDRWEYYDQSAATASKAIRSVLVRAEEANGTNQTITRREYYEHGVIQRVEEDTDFDGRVDKWEQYDHGALVRMDLDLAGRGFPDRRLIYGSGGTLERTEADPTGDGRFKPPVPTPPPGGGRQE